MLGRVPAGAGEPIVRRALDQEVFGLHAAACELAEEIGHAQLHRGDLCQAEIFVIQRGGDDPKAGHQPVEIYFPAAGAAQKPFEIGSRADGIAARAALDQRCAREKQPVLAA
jgi:hypothetical protein